MDRRNFLKTLGVASFSALLPNVITINPPDTATSEKEVDDEDFVVLRVHKSMLHGVHVSYPQPIVIHSCFGERMCLKSPDAIQVNTTFYVYENEWKEISDQLMKAWRKN